MFTIDLDFIFKIKQATLNKQIVWQNVEGYLCSDTTYNGSKYIICKYPLDDGSYDVSFNKLNAYNNIIRPYREFSKGSVFYEELIELSDLVWKTKIMIAA